VTQSSPRYGAVSEKEPRCLYSLFWRQRTTAIVQRSTRQSPVVLTSSFIIQNSQLRGCGLVLLCPIMKIKRCILHLLVSQQSPRITAHAIVSFVTDQHTILVKELVLHVQTDGLPSNPELHFYAKDVNFVDCRSEVLTAMVMKSLYLLGCNAISGESQQTFRRKILPLSS
jgi:hypothetical protein